MGPSSRCGAALSVAVLLQLLYGGALGGCKRSFNPTTQYPDDCSTLDPPCYVHGTGGIEALEFPDMNTRTCYRTCHDDGNMYSPSFCNASLTGVHNNDIAYDSQLVLNLSTWTISSPNYYKEGKDYRKSTICRYNVTCPEGEVLAYVFQGHTLENETDTCDTNGSTVCVDYVKISLKGSPEEIVHCGPGENLHTVFAQGYSSVLVEFYANREEEEKGFEMNLMCYDPALYTPPESLRRRRQESRRENEGQWTMCVDVPGDEPRPVVDSAEQLQEVLEGVSRVHSDLRPGNREDRCRVKVVRELETLHYSSGRLSVSKGERREEGRRREGEVVTEEVASGIMSLAVSTEYERTRVFRGSAERSIMGYAELWVCRDMAYVLRLGIDPQAKPTKRETDIIFDMWEAISDATVCKHYFDVYDEEDAAEEAEERKKQRGRGRPLVEEPTASTGCKDPIINRDARLDDKARHYATACNIFLRAAACTYQATFFSQRDCSPDCCQY